MVLLPAWMHPQITHDAGAPAVISRPRRHSVVRRALNAFARLLAAMLADEATAAAPGLLQRIDARAKVLGIIGLIVVVTLVYHLPALLLGYTLCIVLAILSRVPVRRFAGAWLAAPLFTAAIILPALFNVVSPGTALWQLASPGSRLGSWLLPDGLAVTDVGLYIAARFVLRTAVCVTLALLLTVTTRPARLFRGLHILGVPQLFVMLLTMMERYLAVIVRAAEEIHLAKLSRTLAAGDLRREQAWVAAGMGSLYRRTQRLGDAVYRAMLSRGYTGDIFFLTDTRWTMRDYAFLAVMVAVGIILLMV